MKINEVFKKVVAEATESTPAAKEVSSFAKLGGESDSDTDDGPPGEEITSMSQAFRKFADQGRQNDRDERENAPKKKKKKAIIADDTEEDPIVKISIPKKGEKSKKALPKEEEVEESEDQEEEEGEQTSKKKEVSVTEETEEEDEKSQGKSQLSEAEEKALAKLLAIDPDLLVSQTGQPVSKKVADNIRALKQHLEYFANKTRKLEKSVPGFDPTLKNNYDMVKSALDELKKKYSDRYFEETPEWEESFVKPLKTASEEMGKWLKSHDQGEDTDALGEMKALRSELEEALVKGDDVMYYEKVDALADYLKKGASTRFLAAAPGLWDAFQKKEEAYKNKDEARKKIREQSGSVVEEEAKRAQSTIDTSLKAFETQNAHIINAYKNDPAYREYIDYENTVEVPVANAKEHLSIALKQRRITPALSDLVVKGALFDLKQKEHAGFLERISDLEKQNQVLSKRLEQREGVINKVKPSRGSVTDDDDDDEEDTNQASSFTEHFKRKRALGLV